MKNENEPIKKDENEPIKEGADNTLEYSEVDAKADAKAKPVAEKTPDKKGDNSKTEMVDSIKKDAEKLIDTQNKIIGGFEKIDPYMKQAEQLIEKIDSTAKQIETINKSKVEQYKNAK
jgi:hypothetical protein